MRRQLMRAIKTTIAFGVLIALAGLHDKRPGNGNGDGNGNGADGKKHHDGHVPSPGGVKSQIDSDSERAKQERPTESDSDDTKDKSDTLPLSEEAARKKLHDAVKQRYEDIRDPNSEHYVPNKRRSPVVSGVIDRRTGEVIIDVNHSAPPSDLHPLLQERLDNLHATGGDRSPGAHSTPPGSHAEFYALNRQLNNLPPGEEPDLSNYVVDNLRTKGAAKGEFIECCQNCSLLLTDVTDADRKS